MSVGGFFSSPVNLFTGIFLLLSKSYTAVIRRQNAALFLSRSRLSTRFKAETGKNLSDYIAEERIEEAKRLLVYTDKSLSAVSAYLCFSSQSHFSRTFKKFTGRTPADYRENTPK